MSNAQAPPMIGMLRAIRADLMSGACGVMLWLW